MNPWTDPDRWVSADHQRNAWLAWFTRRLLLAAAVTAAVILLGLTL